MAKWHAAGASAVVGTRGALGSLALVGDAVGAANAARACGEWGGFGHGEHFDALPDNLPPRRMPAVMAPFGAASAPLSHDGQPSMKGTRS